MGTEPVSGLAFCDALAQFASGVTVVAAATRGGLVGFTATGFTSVSLAPPLILVCVGQRASAHDGVVQAERFGVSVLAERQAWIAEQFARSNVDRFRDVSLVRAPVPIIEGAIASLDCRHHARLDAGDHTILLGEVLEAHAGTGRPLVYCGRRYGIFTSESFSRSASPAADARQGGTA